MNLFKKLFEKNKQEEVVYKTEMPEHVNSANKIYNKEFDSAIMDLKKQLESSSQNDYEKLSMIHINLMQAYFKDRNNHSEYLELSIEHAKQALICGHNTGLAPFRLIVNLEKVGKLNKAIEVCTLVTNEKYSFSPTGYKQKPEFVERLVKLQKKLETKGDTDTEKLFSEREKELAFLNSSRN